MADLRTRLTLDGSDYQRGMNEAEQSTKQFSDASKMTASELLKQMKTMDNLGRSTSNYRQQLGQMTRQIQDLTVNYRAMSDEMKQSDFGKAVAKQITELTQKASEMKDSIQDAASSVKLLASDTAKLDAAKQGIEGLSSVFSLIASAGILGADSTERLVKVMARLKAIESATNAIIKISNVLNKDSILMLTIKNAQTKLATKATVEYAAATGTATVAQKTFNTVAKANPYVLLATAVLTVVGALAAFSKGTQQAEDDQASLNKELKQGTDLQKTYSDTFNQTFSSLIYTFRKLQTGWKQLKNDLEKTEFIKKNADEFKKLGVEVTGVKQAEDILVNNSQLFVKTLDLRAQAAAAAAVAMEAYKEAMDIDMKGFDQLPKAGDLVPAGTANPARYGLAWDHMEADGMHHDYKFTQAGADQYIIENKLATAYVNKTKAIDKANKALQTQADIEQKLNNLTSQFISPATTNNGSGGASSKTTPSFEEGSLAWYDNQIQALQNLIKNEKLSQEELEKINAKINDLEKSKLEYIQSLRGGAAELIPILKPISTQEAITTLQEHYEEHPIEIPVNFIEINKQIGDAISGVSSLNSSLANTGRAIEDLGDGWDDSKSGLDNITTKVDDLLTIMQSVTGAIDTINTLTKITTGMDLVQWQLEKKKNSEKMKGLGLEAAETGTKGANASLSVVEAIAGVIKSASEIPMVGWILGLGAVAAVIAAIASAPKFAKGGVVPGTSFSGDNVMAQVNSGEMILNTQQQRNLFNLLNNPNAANSNGGQVEFTIKGQDLKGVLRNYDTKISRI